MSAMRSRNSSKGLLSYRGVALSSLSLFLISWTLRRGGLSPTAIAVIVSSEMACCNLIPAIKAHTVGLACPTICLNALWNASRWLFVLFSDSRVRPRMFQVTGGYRARPFLLAVLPSTHVD